jgi:hypothetical protein
MTLNAYKKGLIMGASHDGSREFLSLLACICADGTNAVLFSFLGLDLEL